MMGAMDILRSAITRATQPGPIEVPSALIAAIEAQPDPFQAISDRDASNEIFEAIRSQFLFINFIRAIDKPPSDEDFEKLTGLLRWIIRESTGWSNSADPQRIRLVALFVAEQFIAMGTSFWTTVSDGFRPSDEFLAELEKVIAGMIISFTPRGLIWESEAIERFKKADAESDWIGIAQGWRLIEGGFFRNIAIAQAVQCLDRFSPHCLVQAVSGLRQTASIMSVVLSLDPGAALRLGSGSANAHVQFAVTYRVVSPRVNQEPLGSASKEFLTQILEKVSKDAQRWTAWMRVFNLFPSQSPKLQVPLGCALADADDAALQAYVDAIDLHWSGQQTRFAVADCLRAFRDKAEIKKRRALWNLAYQRWTSWKFGLNGTGESLTKIARCELDYALVGYFTECLDDTQRRHILASLIKKLQVVEDTWHPRIIDCLSRRNAVLSELQPLCLAMDIACTEADWIEQESMMRLPFDPEKESYMILKYDKPQIS